MHTSARLALVSLLVVASLSAVGAPAIAASDQAARPAQYTTAGDCVSFTQTGLLFDVQSSITKTLPRFNPALGALQGVTIGGSATGTGTASFEVLGGAPKTVSYNVGALVDVSAPGFATTVAANATVNGAAAKSGYDGIDDFAGSSGGVVSPSVTDAIGPATMSTPGQLAQYVGTGSISVGVISTGKSSLTLIGGGSAHFVVTSQVSGQVCVTYTYIATDRIEGADRYSTAVEISKIAFPLGGVPVVYVATGANYPDALSAGPVAVKDGAPLLLTATDSLPVVVQNEITRLSPDRIVVVGGPGSVSDHVFDQLEALQPQTERIGGVDRYDTSRQVINSVFGAASVLYIANGRNFPDALSAGGAAGSAQVPVLLVDGGRTTLDTVTLNLINALGADEIKVMGSVAAVSAGIASQLASHTGTVTRIDGVDRFVVSRAVNADAFTSASQAFLATGFNFPDALAGSALAGKVGAPLYIIPGTCVPAGIIADLNTLGVDDVTILGGAGTVGIPVNSLTAC